MYSQDIFFCVIFLSRTLSPQKKMLPMFVNVQYKEIHVGLHCPGQRRDYSSVARIVSGSETISTLARTPPRFSVH